MGKAVPYPTEVGFELCPGPAGRSRAGANGPVQSGELHSHRFMDLPSTPGPSCFSFGSMFPGVPIHRIAGAFRPNRAMLRQASQQAHAARDA